CLCIVYVYFRQAKGAQAAFCLKKKSECIAGAISLYFFFLAFLTAFFGAFATILTSKLILYLFYI
ncbi:MAG: hypothetical protein ACM3JE_04100, partial [Betaproteobacteria bacterium]